MAEEELLVPRERPTAADALQATAPQSIRRSKHKNPISSTPSATTAAVTFNQADRIAYVTGFAKRKRERRERALKEYAQKERKEQLQRRQERREARKAALANQLAENDTTKRPHADIADASTSASGRPSTDSYMKRAAAEGMLKGADGDRVFRGGVTVRTEAIELPSAVSTVQRTMRTSNEEQADEEEDNDSVGETDAHAHQKQQGTGPSNATAKGLQESKRSVNKQREQEQLEKVKKRLQARQGVSKKQAKQNRASSTAGKKKTRVTKKAQRRKK